MCEPRAKKDLTDEDDGARTHAATVRRHSADRRWTRSTSPAILPTHHSRARPQALQTAPSLSLREYPSSRHPNYSRTTTSARTISPTRSVTTRTDDVGSSTFRQNQPAFRGRRRQSRPVVDLHHLLGAERMITSRLSRHGGCRARRWLIEMTRRSPPPRRGCPSAARMSGWHRDALDQDSLATLTPVATPGAYSLCDRCNDIGLIRAKPQPTAHAHATGARANREP